MDRDALINCFRDTLRMSVEEKLRDKTFMAIQSNKVYKEGFVPKIHVNGKHAMNGAEVCSGTTFEIAKKYSGSGKVAVLNFANPEYAGGGVQNGAMAQEECLCRSSNLYACISNENVFEEYYGYHQKLGNHFYSDRLIYTKDVTVFKNDDIYPKLMPESEWFQVDVITCAAPYLGGRGYINETVLLSVFRSRISNIFKAAIDNQVDVIILGAFGCGAFKNHPKLVAEAFEREISRYGKLFEKVVFAIKPTGENCPNLNAFFRKFKVEEECCILGTLDDWRTYKIPEGLTFYTEKNKKDFQFWQKYKNKYYGKQFSILGDSISTLEGCHPRDYYVFYKAENCQKSGVIQMSDTWWGQVISFLGGELLVNNSWSGSRVTKLPETKSLFPSGCSDERTSALHINDVKPDVIMISIGFNDWASGVKTGNKKGRFFENRYECFDYAYSVMLKKIRKNYPDSELWCCTLGTTYMSENPNFHFPYEYAGITVGEYNKIIRQLAVKNQCRLIELCDYVPYDTLDGTHPNKKGMESLAGKILCKVVDSEGAGFLELMNASGISLQSEEFLKCDQKNTFVGTTIYCNSGNYAVLKVTGHSRFQSNYLVLKTGVNQPYTMIVWNKQAYANTELAAYSAVIRNFTMMKELVHPGIPKVCDIFEDDKHVFIIRDFINGKALSEIIREDKTVPADIVVSWGIQLCNILEYLHSQTPPIIYEDMDPAKIILQPNGTLKLIEIESKLSVSEKKEDEGYYIMASKGYSAPESFVKHYEMIDARTDVYSLGAIMYHLLTGHSPAEPPYIMYPICQWNPKLPKKMEKIILKCTQPNPKERYQSCIELLNDLNIFIKN